MGKVGINFTDLDIEAANFAFAMSASDLAEGAEALREVISTWGGAVEEEALASKVGPAANIPEHLNPAAFIERGMFQVTETSQYVVRTGSPRGGYAFSTPFESREEAMSYAERISAAGQDAIREEFGLKPAWNAVESVHVFEIPAGTPTISGVAAPQEEAGMLYVGGGMQTAFPPGILNPTPVATFPVLRR